MFITYGDISVFSKVHFLVFVSFSQAGVLCIDSFTTLFLVPSSKLAVHLGKFIFVPFLFCAYPTWETQLQIDKAVSEEIKLNFVLCLE